MSAVAAQAAAPLAAQALVDFVYDETELIDAGRLEDWLALFAEDGIFWAPLTPGQPDPDLHTSLYHEDRLLLQLRIERLRSARAYAQQPPSRCQHVVERPRVLESDTTANRHVVTAKMVYVETQLDRQTVLAGRLTYTLRQEAGALRIVLRRLDILNCDAAWPSIQCFP